MFKSKEHHFDLGSNNMVAAEVTSRVMIVLLTKNDTQLDFSEQSAESLKNQLKNAMNIAITSAPITVMALELENVFSSFANEEDDLKKLYASFVKEQEEGEQLAMATRQFANRKINLIELSYIAARLMVLTFLKKQAFHVIDEAFDYDPDSFEQLIEQANSTQYNSKSLSDKCIQRLGAAVVDSLEYVKTPVDEQ